MIKHLPINGILHYGRQTMTSLISSSYAHEYMSVYMHVILKEHGLILSVRL